ncbi:MAG: hypothetical protein MI923_07415 [Phycisphaerales bacterium]|nr:hypothetical protein [Phycisphaerales bacterium]
MSDVPQRFEHIRRSARLARLLAVVGIGLLVVVGSILLVGELAPENGFREYLPAIGVLAGVCILTALFIFLWNVVNLLLKIEGNSFRSYGVLRDVHSASDKQHEHLRIVSENVQISDAVRALTHRGRERTALRLAINEEIIRGDWEAAYSLVEQLETRHGYKNEADRLRAEVDRSRALDTQDKLHEAVEQVKSYMAAHDWDRARREMDRLIAQNPGSGEVLELPKLFGKLWKEHKARLLKEWYESVQRNEVDRGIAILKELDHYLTPNEAAALEESARGVFKAKLHNLGFQFTLAVTGQNWHEAYEIGQQITREFPNSRMAQEVRDRAHVLAKRLDEPAANSIPVAAAQE